MLQKRQQIYPRTSRPCGLPAIRNAENGNFWENTGLAPVWRFGIMPLDRRYRIERSNPPRVYVFWSCTMTKGLPRVNKTDPSAAVKTLLTLRTLEAPQIHR